jgi:5'-nucleotidase
LPAARAGTAEARPGAPSGGDRAAGRAAVTQLRVLAINDFHGALEARPDRAGVRRGGAGPLAAAIARARAECQPPACISLLLDGGDAFQGTSTSNLAFGRPVVALFRELDVVAAALGNHEFDWGVDTLAARARETPHALLGANVRTEAGAPLPWLRDDTLLVPRRRAHRRRRRGRSGHAPHHPSAQRARAAVRPHGPGGGRAGPRVARTRRDVVLVVAHVGAFCDADRDNDPGSGGGAPMACTGDVVELARQLTEPVDAIVSGHTHSRVATAVAGIPIVQARSSGRTLGVIDIPLVGSARRAARVPARVEVREVAARLVGAAPPDAVARLVASRARRGGGV